MNNVELKLKTTGMPWNIFVFKAQGLITDEVLQGFSINLLKGLKSGWSLCWPSGQRSPHAEHISSSEMMMSGEKYLNHLLLP